MAVTTNATSWRSSTLAPFATPIFLAIWVTSLISNIGSLIQSVGASWLMTSLTSSAYMVALVQASTSLPIMLLALPAGAASDVWDRRKVMLLGQLLMLAASALLAYMAWRSLLTPWTLLSLTFLLGCGQAMYAPSWQSSVGEQVPRPVLPAAIALNSISFNIARTVGPALGGLVVAVAGAAAAFAINVLTYFGLIAVLVSWRRPKARHVLPPESWDPLESTCRHASLSIL